MSSLLPNFRLFILVRFVRDGCNLSKAPTPPEVTGSSCLTSSQLQLHQNEPNDSLQAAHWRRKSHLVVQFNPESQYVMHMLELDQPDEKQRFYEG